MVRDWQPDSWRSRRAHQIPAYAEMKKYHFDTLFFPHTELKQFVFDYYTQHQVAALGKAGS